MLFLPKLLKKTIRKGRLSLRGPDGKVEKFGGLGPGPDIAIHITKPNYDWKIGLNPELYSGEAYMNGH